MKMFILYWLDGKKEEITGNDISSAFAAGGYGPHHFPQLDFCQEGKIGEVEDLEWKYIKEEGGWKNTTLNDRWAEKLNKLNY